MVMELMGQSIRAHENVLGKDVLEFQNRLVQLCLRANDILDNPKSAGFPHPRSLYEGGVFTGNEFTFNHPDKPDYSTTVLLEREFMSPDKIPLLITAEVFKKGVSKPDNFEKFLVVRGQMIHEYPYGKNSLNGENPEDMTILARAIKIVSDVEAKVRDQEEPIHFDMEE